MFGIPKAITNATTSKGKLAKLGCRLRMEDVIGRDPETGAVVSVVMGQFPLNGRCTVWYGIDWSDHPDPRLRERGFTLTNPEEYSSASGASSEYGRRVANSRRRGLVPLDATESLVKKERPARTFRKGERADPGDIAQAPFSDATMGGQRILEIVYDSRASKQEGRPVYHASLTDGGLAKDYDPVTGLYDIALNRYDRDISDIRSRSQKVYTPEPPLDKIYGIDDDPYEDIRPNSTDWARYFEGKAGNPIKEFTQISSALGGLFSGLSNTKPAKARRRKGPKASHSAKPGSYDLGYVGGDTCVCPRCHVAVKGVDASYEVGHPGHFRFRQTCPTCGSKLSWQDDIWVVDMETGEPVDIVWTSSDGDWAILGYFPGAGTIWYDDAIGIVEVLWPYDDNVLAVFLLKDGTIKWGFDDDDDFGFPPEVVAQAEAMLATEYAKYTGGRGTVTSKRTKPAKSGARRHPRKKQGGRL